MKKYITLATLALLMHTAAEANDKLRYDYIDFGYIHSEGERTSDKTGYELNLSLAFDDTWYVRSTLQSQSADVWVAGSQAEVTAKEYEMAFGFHVPSSRTDDFFMEAGYVKFDGDGVIPQTTYGNDEDGFLVNLGLRGRLSTNWEYKLFAGYKDYDFSPYVNEALHEDSTSTTYGLEGRYYLSKNWSFGIKASEEITGLTSGFDFRLNL
ncbi:hypothetical protein [Kangiella geojedonensis]|uniref:Outer membrane protein beta-barrel domain-containing protein n=1 Tax=Kangiella geojedonensis TaxID=914150 RepID=A0A0F6RBG7_9GAMM|nr:hypothetical protein [Kangiella geojedonensis]AKE51543.1 hypothetical protein TQ33_0562 [Kangiella geojedonensis]